MIQGIYRIRHLGTDAAYVGQASNIHKRWVAHRYKLRLNRHTSPKLQMFWNTYGAVFFVFEVLERIEKWEDLQSAEQRYIDAEKILLNQVPRAGGGPIIGHKGSESTRQKISAINKGRKHSAEFRAAQSAQRLGKPRKLSPEGRAKMSAFMSGNKYNGKSNQIHCIYGHLLPTRLRSDGRRKNCFLCSKRRCQEHVRRKAQNLNC